MMSELTLWKLSTEIPDLEFSLDLPSDWTTCPQFVRSSTLSSSRPSLLANMHGSDNSHGNTVPWQLKATAIPLAYDLNATDLGLAYLLTDSLPIVDCDGKKLPSGKVGRFVYETAQDGQGRLLATRNGKYVLLVQIESSSDIFSVDDALDSFQFLQPNPLPIEAPVPHSLPHCQFDMPTGWSKSDIIQDANVCLMRHEALEGITLLIEESQLEEAPQSSLYRSLQRLEATGIRYTGSILLPSPGNPNFERQRMQTACTIGKEEGVLLAMHHASPTSHINIVACLPLAIAQPVEWATGKYALEMALSSICIA